MKASRPKLSEGYAEKLAAFAAHLTYEDLPQDVIRQTKVLLLDTLGALLAASSPKYSAGRIISEFVRQLGGSEESTVVGQDFKTSCVDAALANGTMGYYCDIESHHPGAIVHAAAVTVPSALAVGERERTDGKTLLVSMALGLDVACRVSLAIGPTALYRRGFHPTSVSGGC